MQFQVTNIEFDFVDDEGELPIDIQNEILDDVYNIIWESDDEEDISEAMPDEAE